MNFPRAAPQKHERFPTNLSSSPRRSARLDLTKSSHTGGLSRRSFTVHSLSLCCLLTSQPGAFNSSAHADIPTSGGGPCGSAVLSVRKLFLPPSLKNSLLMTYPALSDWNAAPSSSQTWDPGATRAVSHSNSGLTRL